MDEPMYMYTVPSIDTRMGILFFKAIFSGRFNKESYFYTETLHKCSKFSEVNQEPALIYVLYIHHTYDDLKLFFFKKKLKINENDLLC